MAFNLNMSKKVDYGLQHTMTDELITLYGVECKLMLIERINQDDLVFGDYTHLKSDSSKIFTVYGMPETSEQWDDVGVNFSQFGMLNLETIRLWFSRKTIDGIFSDFDSSKGFSNIIGNLIVLPNDRIVEITDIEFEVPGVSNLYTNNDQKNVYKFTCKTHDNKLASEVPSQDLGGVDTVGDYTELDDYFNELSTNKTEVDTGAEVTPEAVTQKPVVQTDEDSVFGRF